MDYLIMLGLSCLGAVLWIVNTEVSYIAVYKFGHTNIILLSIVAGFGSSIGLSVFYYLGKNSVRLSKRLANFAKKIDVEKFKKSTFSVLASSFLFSLPPCTSSCVASGMFKVRFLKFFLTSIFFRTIRYSILGLILYSSSPYLEKLSEYVMSYIQ